MSSYDDRVRGEAEKKFQRPNQKLDAVEMQLPKKKLLGLVHKESKDNLRDAVSNAISNVEKITDDVVNWHRNGKASNRCSKRYGC
jgi:hypothetical protein